MSPSMPAKSFVLISGDFARTGGMDRANFAMADYLSRQGHEVHLVAHRADEALLARANVMFHRVAKPLNSYLLASPLLAWRGRAIAKRLSAAGARVIANGGNCCFGDVNWVHYVHAAYAPATHTGHLRQIKSAIERRLFLGQEKAALRCARLVIANSYRTRDDILHVLAISPERVRVVYLGADVEAFLPPTPEQKARSRTSLGLPTMKPIVLFVGALGDRRKGFDTLLAAWRNLCVDMKWDADLAVVGGGAELPFWKDRVAAMGLTSRIHFLGFRSDMPNVLAACDMIVAPARYEPYGLGVHEAICAGLGVIVSRSAGVAERCPPALAPFTLLDNHEDSVELSRLIVKWRTAGAVYQTHLTQWRQILRAQTWDRMAAQMLQLVEGAPASSLLSEPSLSSDAIAHSSQPMKQAPAWEITQGSSL